MVSYKELPPDWLVCYRNMIYPSYINSYLTNVATTEMLVSALEVLKPGPHLYVVMTAIEIHKL